MMSSRSFAESWHGGPWGPDYVWRVVKAWALLGCLHVAFHEFCFGSGTYSEKKCAQDVKTDPSWTGLIASVLPWKTRWSWEPKRQIRMYPDKQSIKGAWYVSDSCCNIFWVHGSVVNCQGTKACTHLNWRWKGGSVWRSMFGIMCFFMRLLTGVVMYPACVLFLCFCGGLYCFFDYVDLLWLFGVYADRLCFPFTNRRGTFQVLRRPPKYTMGAEVG